MIPLRTRPRLASLLSLVATSLVTPAVMAQGGAQTNRDAIPGVSHTGVQLSESALLHVAITAEAGYDSNVFYGEQGQRIDSAVLRVTPSIEITNATREGAKPDGLFYALGASLQYREYVHDDVTGRARRTFNPVASATLAFGSSQTLSLTVSDQFMRMEEPPYVAGTENIIRDYNLGWLQLTYRPNGGRLELITRYTNTLDYYETAQFKGSSNLGHDLLVDGSWRWFPKTALYFQVGQGYISYLNGTSAERPSSYPLRIMAGLRGLLTSRLLLNVGAGYGAGFYQGGGVNPSGLSSFLVSADISYQPSLRSRLGVGYRREFRNSPIVGSFYDVDSPYASASYLVGSRLTLSVIGRYEYRRFQGIRVVAPTPGAMETSASRTDHFMMGGALADFFVQKWFYVGVSYNLLFNDTVGSSTVGSGAEGVNYIKQVYFGRIGITY